MNAYSYGLLSFLDLWVNGLHVIQKKFAQFFCIFFLSPCIFSVSGSLNTHMSDFYTFSQVTEAPSFVFFFSVFHFVLVLLVYVLSRSPITSSLSNLLLILYTFYIFPHHVHVSL